MTYEQLIFGMLGVVVAGCAVGLPSEAFADNGISRREGWLECPEVKLTKIFGVNEEMLADTNRFPVSSCRWYGVDLPEAMGGFRTVEFSLKDDKGKFGIYNATMTKVLSAEADDCKLLEEFKSAVDMVGKLLGVELECPGLINVDKWKRRWGIGVDTLRLYSDLRVKLADGYEISISAKDATYVKRNGGWRLVSNASVEVELENANLQKRQLSELESGLAKLGDRLHKHSAESKNIDTVREVEFGVDLSQQLSEAVKEEAEDRASGRQRNLCIRRLEKMANTGDVNSMRMLVSAYRWGIGGNEDKDLVFKYSKMAADAGDAQGIAALAACYEEGMGTPKDAAKAASLRKKAAEMGDAP